MAQAHWTKARNGNFNTAADWSTGTVPGQADDAILDAAGKAFTVTATTNEDVNSIQTSANATLFLKGDPNNAHIFTVENGTANGVNAGTVKVGDNVELQLFAYGGKSHTYFDNSGTISLNAKTNNSFLEVQAYNGGGGGLLEFTGHGSIVMSDSALNGIVDMGRYPDVIFNVDNTISGAGVIGDGGLVSGTPLGFDNFSAGVINATGTKNALVINAPGAAGFANFANQGLMEATGKAGLDFAATTVDNRSGTILAANGSIVRLESSNIQGGTLESAGTGVILASGGSTLDGAVAVLTNDGAVQVLGDSMYAVGSLVNAGAINLYDAGSGATLKIDVGVALSGAGTVTLSDNFQNAIQGYGGASDLINIDNTISGAGSLGGEGLYLDNRAAGVIDATGAYNPLIVGTPGMTFINSGLIEGTGKAGLNVAGVTLDESSGGTLSAGAASIVRLESSAVIGGALVNAATGQVVASGGSSLSGVAVTNAGLLSVIEGDTLSVSGSIANSGAVSLAGTSSGAHLMLTGNLAVSGGGNILLGVGGSIDSAAAADTFTNLDNRITGDGEIGGGATKLVNGAAGVIVETGTGGLLVDSAKLTNAGLIEAAGVGDVSIIAAVANSGTLRADKGSMLSLTGAVNNSGVLSAHGGTLIAFQAVTGTGSATIGGGALEFMKGFDEAVSFTGKSGVLELAKSQSYTQTVTGFSASGGTSFDLADIKFVSASEASFSGTAAGGVLTVTDGTHTAMIHLAGDFTGSSFVTTKDGGGGVIVKAATALEVPPPSGFVAAMAGMGGGAPAAAHVAATPSRLDHPVIATPRG